jgi:hypothetical protein
MEELLFVSTSGILAVKWVEKKEKNIVNSNKHDAPEFVEIKCDERRIWSPLHSWNNSAVSGVAMFAIISFNVGVLESVQEISVYLVCSSASLTDLR